VSSLLGGSPTPLGRTVAFIEAPHAVVLSQLLERRERLGEEVDVRNDLPGFPECLQTLTPLEAPRTAELLVVHGITWTAYLDNTRDDAGHGDPTPGSGSTWAAVSEVAHTLDVPCVMVTYLPLDREGRAATRFRLFLPDVDERPDRERALDLSAANGRWHWRTEGDALPFERTDSYRSRRTRERLTRELLVSYLASLEIFVDDDSLYGMATLVRTRVPGMDDT